MRTLYSICTALLCFMMTVSGEEECGASALFCPKHTGGTCNFLSCDKTRHATPHGGWGACTCDCDGSLCAINGQCLTTTTTTAKPDEAQCNRAYEDRCFSQDPFASSGSTGKCCGECNTGKTSNVCQWSFEETNPQRGFSSSFPLDNSIECEKACKTLNSASITRYDFCEVEATQTHAVIVACGNAKKSLEKVVPSTLCNREAEGDRVCKWSHTRQSAHSPCGNGEKPPSSISGTFNYASDNQGGACDSACEALGTTNAEPADFCHTGKIASIVRQCGRAWKSLNDSNISPDWCDMTFTELTANPQIKVAAASDGDICDKAYKNDCWKQGAFKQCCEDCNEHSASATCEWSFTGPSEYEGDKCKHEPIEVKGSFSMFSKASEKKECFQACNKLSKDIRETKDLCAGSELFRALDGCAEAKTSVQDALKTTTWCPTNHSERKEEAAALHAVMLASGDLCEAAYNQRCWEQKPWSDCCGKCSAGTDEQTCTWSYQEDWKDFKMTGSFGLNSDNCKNACNLFNNNKNKRSDYCSGDIHKAVAECPGARASLKSALPENFCEDTEKSHVTCTWKFSYDAHVNSEGYKTLGAHLNGYISSSFDYSIPDDENDLSCQTACAALGYNNNLPSSYCDGSEVWNTIKKCPAAMASLKAELEIKTDLEKAWCAPKSVRLPHNGQIDYFTRAATINPIVFKRCKGVNTLTTCHAAFSQRCYNSSAGQKKEGRQAFSQCCENCLSAHVITTCDWSINSPHGKMGTTFEYPPASDQCFKSCTGIQKGTAVEDLCPGGTIFEEVKKCPSAWPPTLTSSNGMLISGIASVKAEMCRHRKYFEAKCNIDMSTVDWCGGMTTTATTTQQMMLSENAQLLQNTIGASSVGFWALVAFMFFIGTAIAFLLKRRRAQRHDGYVHLAA